MRRLNCICPLKLIILDQSHDVLIYCNYSIMSLDGAIKREMADYGDPTVIIKAIPCVQSNNYYSNYGHLEIQTISMSYDISNILIKILAALSGLKTLVSNQ